MADGAFEDYLSQSQPQSDVQWDKVRANLVRRLQDVVGLPTSRISPQERAMAADLLVEALRECDTPTRHRTSERMALLHEVPANLLRCLAQDDIEVARPLLEVCEGFDDSDLLFAINSPVATLEHRLLIAKRKHVSEVCADALAAFEEMPVIVALLRNPSAKLAYPAIERATAMSKTHPVLIPMLLKRPELVPSQALTLFWWADGDARVRILERFAVERLTLFEACSDLFAQAAKGKWQDALVRKCLQFIERRQRNRAAIERSPFESMEAAIDTLGEAPTRQTLMEITFMAGVKPACGAQILGDAGGEALAVMAKATGLKRRYLRNLWEGLRRPVVDENEPESAWGRALRVYDTLSTNKAQTVLRYWNWSLTSAMSPALASKMEESAEGDDAFAFSSAARTSRLVFGKH